MIEDGLQLLLSLEGYEGYGSGVTFAFHLSLVQLFLQTYQLLPPNRKLFFGKPGGKLIEFREVTLCNVKLLLDLDLSPGLYYNIRNVKGDVNFCYFEGDSLVDAATKKGELLHEFFLTVLTSRQPT